MTEILDDRSFDLLLELAHLAVDEQMTSQAQIVFAALAQARPGDPHPAIGLALVAYREHRLDEAIERLQRVIQAFPAAVFARSVLALVLQQRGEPGWRRFADESLALNASGAAADLARALILAGD